MSTQVCEQPKHVIYKVGIAAGISSRTSLWTHCAFWWCRLEGRACPVAHTQVSVKEVHRKAAHTQLPRNMNPRERPAFQTAKYSAFAQTFRVHYLRVWLRFQEARLELDSQIAAKENWSNKARNAIRLDDKSETDEILAYSPAPLSKSRVMKCSKEKKK